MIEVVTLPRMLKELSRVRGNIHNFKFPRKKRKKFKLPFLGKSFQLLLIWGGLLLSYLSKEFDAHFVLYIGH